MVRVKLVANRFTAEGKLVGHLESDFIVNGPTVITLKGESDWVKEIRVPDSENKCFLDFETDPERWAHLLPLEFRSGDLDCEVEEMDMESGVKAVLGSLDGSRESAVRLLTGLTAERIGELGGLV